MKRLLLVISALCVMCTTVLAFNFGFDFGFGGNRNIQYEDLLPVLTGWEPSSKVFGNTSTGVVKRQSFSFTNTGNDYAEDVTVSVTGTGFSLYSTTTFGNISSLRTLTAKVRFSPVAATEYSGFINYSAPNIARLRAVLTGTGVNYNPPSAPTNIVATPGDGTITTTWTAGVGSTSSLFKRGVSSGVYGNHSTVTSPHVVDGVNGTSQYILVGASNSNGITWGTEVSATPAINCSNTPSVTYTAGTSVDIFVGYSDNRTSLGNQYSGVSSYNACSVGFYMKIGAGDISSKNYVVKVYSTVGNNGNLGTLKGTSSTVSGSIVTASPSEVKFSFSPAVTITTNDVVLIVTSDNSRDASNYAAIQYGTGIADWSWNQYAFDGSFYVDDLTKTMNFNVYQ